ncbi:MAG: glucuronyl hydrolase, partial [Cyclobacteriaceae bacterium]|nr:glucuronyl hydrolase [Cyclobacteriaceae bacterium]
MKRSILTLLTGLMILISCNNKNEKEVESDEKDFVANSFVTIEKQLSAAIEQYQDLTKFPRSTNPDGTLHTRAANNWVSGFFPGSLWYMYEFSKDNKWKVAAEKWTEAVSEQQFNTGTHDVGFIINCSYGNGLRLTKNKAYSPVI